jgi:hypothetical protein
MSKRKNPQNKRLTRVSVVEAELRDEIDWDRFAWALLQFCRAQIEAEDAERP